MELNKPLVVKNVLMITDHFTRCALVVVTKDQTTKTVMKVFYECFIVVFGAPVRLLSDSGANFTSALVEEPPLTMPSTMGRWNAFTKHCSA